MHDIKATSLINIKAGEADGLGEGEFKGYVAVFNNQDSYGDIIRPGAFLKSIAEWTASGKNIPAYFAHDMNDAFANIGEVLEAVEDEKGLLVHVRLDLDNPTAKQVYKLLKGRRIDQMSIGYRTVKHAWVEDSAYKWGGYNELQEIKLYEASVVPIGANEETEILAVKSQPSGPPVVIKKSDNDLKAKVSEIEKLLTEIKASLATTPSDNSELDGKEEQASAEDASTSEPVKDEEPTAVKSQEPMREVSAPLSIAAAELEIQLLAL